jgi:hypothetical protein
LDLEDDFYSFEGGGDGCHGDGAEEASCGVLRESHSCGGYGGESMDEGFADVVALQKLEILP